MTSVLIVSYDWPPKGTVGMIRVIRFAKYLIKCGYCVNVLTKDIADSGNLLWDIDEPLLERVSVIRVKPLDRGSFLNSAREKLCPQFEMNWYAAVMKRLDTLLKGIDFDIVMSTSPPESTHYIAATIKEKYGKAWIADFRDLWSRDHYRGLGWFRRAYLRNAERGILNKADIVITVSKLWAESLCDNYKGRVEVITNGYDDEYFERIPLRKKDKFVISYLGKLNARYQKVAPLMDALKHLIETGCVERQRVEVNFYISGFGKPDIMHLAQMNGIPDVVREHAPITFSRALGVMKNSSLLLLIGWDSPYAKGWRPQKAYEYIGSGTPILLINGEKNEELTGFVRSTKSGSIAKDAHSIEEEMLRYYNDFTEGTNRTYEEKRNPPEEFNAANITKKLCRIVEHVKK